MIVLKLELHDFGIIGMTLTYDMTKKDVYLVGHVLKSVKQLSTGALKMLKTIDLVRDHKKCIGCGECILNCPTSAWTRDEKKYYRLVYYG